MPEITHEMLQVARQVLAGDVYCPSCLSEQISCPNGYGPPGAPEFKCHDCGWETHGYSWRYDGARADWDWTGHRRPNLGCPVCGTCNITGAPAARIGKWWAWRCCRVACAVQWIGLITHREGLARWKIRLTADQVPHRPAD